MYNRELIEINRDLGARLNINKAQRFIKLPREGIKRIFKGYYECLEDIYFEAYTEEGEWYKILINLESDGPMLFDVIAN